MTKVYIDKTVDRLQGKDFWKKYADVSFVGPNVVTLNGEVFSAAPLPLSALSGTYYVTEEGVLYALDPIAGTAALSYCPSGISELYIPNYLTATEEMTGEADIRYARSYKVAGVTQHAVMAASDLTSVTAANPGQITLSVRAFADCPTLTSVNGVTTQKEANAFFGLRGTPAIKKAFVNTGLSEDEEPPAVPGKPMRSLKYTNPNGGVLTVQLHEMEKYQDAYREDAYRALTGEGRTFDIKAEAYGTGDLATRFCVYFEASDPALAGMKAVNKVPFEYTLDGKSFRGEMQVSHDRISGCYCISFSMPGGATTALDWERDLQQGQIMYPVGTKGGSLSVWGEVPDATDMEPGNPDDGEEDEIFGGFTGNENYMVLDWSTMRNHYDLGLNDREQRAQLNTNTHRPRYDKAHGVEWRQIYFLERGEVNRGNYGRDEVTAVVYRYDVICCEL